MKQGKEGKTIDLKARELFLRPRCSNNSQPLYCSGTQKPPYSTSFGILCKTMSRIIYTFTKKDNILCKTIYISAIRQGKS